MNRNRALTALGILAFAAALAIVFVPALVNRVLDQREEDDYAALDPAPDAIVIATGDERDYWPVTNRDHVDLRISSVALGVGEFKRVFPDGGHVMDLGRGEGCLDWAVQSLNLISFEEDSDRRMRFQVEVTVDRAAAATDLPVKLRAYGPDGLSIDLLDDSNPSIVRTDMVVLSGNSVHSERFRTTLTSGIIAVEASHDSRFPKVSTLRATADIGDPIPEDTVSGDKGVAELRLRQHGAVSLFACSQASDIEVTLHGDEGVELNRYVVDIRPGPTATPTPTATGTPVPPPDIGDMLRTLRFCPDETSSRAALLTGGETVGAVTATGAGAMTYSLAAQGDSTDYALFDIDGSTGAITVSAAGADDNTGIDGTRLYTFAVVATDSGRRSSQAVMTVQLDLSTASTANDGTCS